MCGGGGIPIISDIVDAVGEVVAPISEAISDIPVVGDVWDGVTGAIGEVVQPVTDLFPSEVLDIAKLASYIYTAGSSIEALSLDAAAEAGAEAALSSSSNFALDSAVNAATAVAEAAPAIDFGSAALMETATVLDAFSSSGVLDAAAGAFSQAPDLAGALANYVDYDLVQAASNAMVQDWAAAVPEPTWAEKALRWGEEAAGFTFDEAGSVIPSGYSVNPITAGASMVGGPAGGLVAKAMQSAFGINPSLALDFANPFTLEGLAAAGLGAGMFGSSISGAADMFSADEPIPPAQTAAKVTPRVSNLKYDPLVGFQDFQPINMTMPTPREQPLLTQMKNIFNTTQQQPTAMTLRNDLLSSLWRPANG